MDFLKNPFSWITFWHRSASEEVPRIVDIPPEKPNKLYSSAEKKERKNGHSLELRNDLVDYGLTPKLQNSMLSKKYMQTFIYFYLFFTIIFFSF